MKRQEWTIVVIINGQETETKRKFFYEEARMEVKYMKKYLTLNGTISDAWLRKDGKDYKEEENG